MKFEVKKIGGSSLFEVDIKCAEDEREGVNLALALHWTKRKIKKQGQGSYWRYKNNMCLEEGNFPRIQASQGITQDEI